MSAPSGDSCGRGAQSSGLAHGEVERRLHVMGFDLPRVDGI